ncbi:MAG TPA: hypothetical protein VOB72_21575 [Candidatus Dormibacteraeota bacterium]|nr:hypothetical protein [Candidatus Dormibacteraeota bacterium]
MLTLVTMASTVTPTTWMVELEAGFTDPARPTPGVEALEPMVELLCRTEGVRSAAAVPRLGGMAIAMGLGAADATTAMLLARGLVRSCARYAGLGPLTIERVRVTPQPDLVEA